mgnify:CR=1 FL=1
MTGKTELTLTVTGLDVYIAINSLKKDGWQVGPNGLERLKETPEEPDEPNIFDVEPSDFNKADDPAPPKEVEKEAPKPPEKTTKAPKTKRKKAPSRFTPEVAEELTRVAPKHTIPQLSQMFNIPPSNISAWLNRRGISFKKLARGRPRGSSRYTF